MIQAMTLIFEKIVRECIVGGPIFQLKEFWFPNDLPSLPKFGLKIAWIVY